MPEQVLQRIFILLEEGDKQHVDVLCRGMGDLLFHGDLTCNLYLVTQDLPQCMPHVERIQDEVTAFLKDRLFVRCYVHLVHPVPEASQEAIRQCYQHLKKRTREFDEEGFRHQELPRLMVLPILVPGAQDGLDGLKALLDTLKGLFMMPSLYLDQTTGFLSKDDLLLASTEKVYNGSGSSEDMNQVLLSLGEQNVFETSCDHLASGLPFINMPCSGCIIIRAKEGVIYPCMDALRSKAGIVGSLGAAHADEIVASCAAHVKDARDCAACRERTLKTLARVSLPEETKHEVGALLYHLGTYRQEAEDHVQALEDYEQSLTVSRPEESSSICFRLGLSYTRTGALERAVEAFRKAEPAYHDQDYFHFHLGFCFFEKGDYSAALEAFSKAAGLDPQPEDMLRILIYMGTCHNCLGEYEAACVPLEQARRIAPDVKEIYNALGFSHFQLKEFDQAIENLQRAVEIDPHSAIDYASLGANYREKGDIGKAIAMYEKALALDPHMTSAQENLERLKEIGMSSKDLAPLEDALGYPFKDVSLLQEALQHSSYVNEQRDQGLRDNERLEFLGDAVLDLVISHLLMDYFPQTREGDLSRMRATVVNESQLAEVSQNLGLGRYILLGRGEVMSSGQQKSSILADALEAVFAAIYLDGGLPAAFEVIRRQFSATISVLEEGVSTEDFKSRLQELVQVRFKTIPDYRVIGESGPDHDKTFDVRLTIGDAVTAHGTGKSKKTAEQAAARDALKQLHGDTEDPPSSKEDEP